MRQRIFICFTGIDGGGKTTHARRLVAFLENQGIQSSYIRNRFQPVILKPFIKTGKALFLRNKDMFKDYAEYYTAKKGLFQSRVVSSLFENAILFEYLLHALLKVRLPLMLGKNVVCDRYVYDTVVGLAVDLGYSNQKVKRILQRLWHLLPKPDLVFLIDLTEDIAYRRKGDTPSVDFLKYQRQIYLAIGKEYGMVILDGARDLVELEEEIKDRVKDIL